MGKARDSAGSAMPEPGRLSGELPGLLTMRMVVLFGLLRRSTLLSLRRVLDLSEIEWRIMTQLGEYAPLSLNGLAELLLQDRGQLSRAVKAMVERGLLSRMRKPGGPEIEIDLTEAGRALYGRMIERARGRDQRLTHGIDPDDLAAVERVIGTMLERANAMVDEARLSGAD